MDILIDLNKAEFATAIEDYLKKRGFSQDTQVTLSGVFEVQIKLIKPLGTSGVEYLPAEK